FPLGVELRPLRHAVDVLPHRLGGKRSELLPRPAFRLGDSSCDDEIPLLERCARSWAGREDREIVDEILTRRNSIARPLVAALAPESTGDEAHGSTLRCANLPWRRSSSTSRRAPRIRLGQPLAFSWRAPRSRK